MVTQDEAITVTNKVINTLKVLIAALALLVKNSILFTSLSKLRDMSSSTITQSMISSTIHIIHSNTYDTCTYTVLYHVHTYYGNHRLLVTIQCTNKLPTVYVAVWIHVFMNKPW